MTPHQQEVLQLLKSAALRILQNVDSVLNEYGNGAKVRVYRRVIAELNNRLPIDRAKEGAHRLPSKNSVVLSVSQTKQELLSDLAHIVIFSDDDSEAQATLEKMAVLEIAPTPSGRVA